MRRTMVFLLVIAGAYWLWFGLTQRSIIGDEGISILGGQAILEHGVPRFPSGMIYHRAYLVSYLLAGSFLVFGLNDFSIMLPNLLLSLGSLWLVYRFASEVFHRPAAGVVAAVLLALQQTQTFYATSARMYMTLEFFMLLAAYSAWRGYVQGRRSFQWITGFAIAGAIFSHQQAGTALVAIPAAVGLVRWMQGNTRRPFSRPLTYGGLAALWGAFYFATVYKLPNALKRIADHGGEDPHYVGFDWSVMEWWRHLLELESTVPLGVVVAPLVLWLVVRAFRARRDEVEQGTVYAFSLFSIGAVGVLAIINLVNWRFWMAVLPIYILVLVFSVMRFADWCRSPVSRRRLWGLPQRTVMSAGLAGWAVMVFTVSAAAFGPGVYVENLSTAYGLPSCTTGKCAQSVEEQYAALRSAVGETDLLISSNPLVTRYYLGRVDGFLREGLKDGRLVPFESPTDERLGVPLIDTLDELKALKRSTRRVWVLTDYKIITYTSERMLGFLEREFTPYRAHPSLTVYVNRDADDT